jgi:hypothetical protein
MYLLIQRLKIRFKKLYLPNPNISIDEILTLWKVCVLFRQNTLLKAAKFGIKSFDLSESSMGYVSCFLIYIRHSMEMTKLLCECSCYEAGGTSS